MDPEKQLTKAVLTAAKSMTPQRIAMVVCKAAAEAGIVDPNGLWSMWLIKAAGTSGEAKV